VCLVGSETITIFDQERKPDRLILALPPLLAAGLSPHAPSGRFSAVR
jgi:hypothetical protein